MNPNGFINEKTGKIKLNPAGIIENAEILIAEGFYSAAEVEQVRRVIEPYRKQSKYQNVLA